MFLGLVAVAVLGVVMVGLVLHVRDFMRSILPFVTTASSQILAVGERRGVVGGLGGTGRRGGLYARGEGWEG